MNILVIGNGFDLAHGLPTKYTDFLEFCKMIEAVYTVGKNRKPEDIWKNLMLEVSNNEEGLRQLLSELYSISMVSKDRNEKGVIVTNTIYDEFNRNIENNDWIDYFLQCDMHGDENWIDFESEISEVIQSIEDDMEDKGLYQKILLLSNKFFNDKYTNNVPEYLTAMYRDEQKKIEKPYITFKELRDRLNKDLNRLIRALEIYLTEYVGKINCKVVSPDIEEVVIKWSKKEDGTVGNVISNVLSFNYSNTYERLYLSKQTSLSEKYMDYIHGKADINNTIDSNNMVLGIDEYLPDDKRNKNIEFICFKKFYQRIHKETGCKYKNWVDKLCEEHLEYLKRQEETNIKEYQYVADSMQRMMKRLAASAIKDEQYEWHNLYIFGHSLDITDGDILRDLILNDNVHTTIFYFNKEQCGQQIANLVKVIGQDELIRRTGGSTKTIEFKLQQDMVDRRYVYEND